MAEQASIRFRLDSRSGLPPFRQIVDQVRHAIALGVLLPGEQLPPVREVVTQVAVNPNTVHRAYRDLESEGLVRGEQGRGTFVCAEPNRVASAETRDRLREQLVAWLTSVRRAGFDEGAIDALIAAALHETRPTTEEVTR